jgi:hypothetical protein
MAIVPSQVQIGRPKTQLEAPHETGWTGEGARIGWLPAATTTMGQEDGWWSAAHVLGSEAEGGSLG